MAIKIKFRYGKHEYIHAVRSHFLKTMKIKLDLVVAALAGLAGAYVFWIDGVSWVSLLASFACLLLLLIVFMALVVLPYQIYRGSDKLKQDYELAFSEEGIHFRTRDIDSHLKWDLYKSWIESPDFFILYYGKREFSVIPKRAFENKDEKNRFKELLAGKVGSK